VRESRGGDEERDAIAFGCFSSIVRTGQIEVQMPRATAGPEKLLERNAIAERLRAVRVTRCGDRGMVHFARDLDVHAETWRNCERVGALTADMLVRVIRLTGVSPLWVLTGEGPMLIEAAPVAVERRAMRIRISRAPSDALRWELIGADGHTLAIGREAFPTEALCRQALGELFAGGAAAISSIEVVNACLPVPSPNGIDPD